MTDWTFSDAWILASLDRSARQTFANADRLNHTVPTIEEFRASVSGLIGSGLAERSSGWFVQTAAGADVVRGHGSTYEQLDVVLAQLTRVPKVSVTVDFDVAAFEDGVRDYLRPGRVARWWKRLASPRRSSGAHSR